MRRAARGGCERASECVTGLPGADETWVHCGQVRTLVKGRLLGEPPAALDAGTMSRVDIARRVSLGMY
ncbi:MAG: hypothetical protein Q8K99_14025 [Actinomycetota bacterium]|nr:hypothetical protein [Actinomycetota bacterium]